MPSRFLYKEHLLIIFGYNWEYHTLSSWFWGLSFCMVFYFMTHSTRPLNDPLHPYMTHPTSVWPTSHHPPLYDPPHPSWPTHPTCRVLKIHKWIWGGGCVWVGEKILKELQVTDKINEWIFFHFIFNLLWMTQTQEIITHPFQRFTNGYEGMGMSREKFPKPWQVRDKMIQWIYKWLTQEIINHRVSKIHKWIWGDVYQWRKVC